MERLFSPCTRYSDIWESQGRVVPPEWMPELNLDVSTEDLLSAEMAFTYADLYTMLGNEYTVAWLTPHVAVVRADGGGLYNSHYLQGRRTFTFTVDGREIVIVPLAHSPEQSLEICDVVLRLMAASVVQSVILGEKWNFRDGALINATSLAYLMEQCQSLKQLSLKCIRPLNSDHCRVLGACSRPDLEIVLIGCIITSAGTSALAEALGRNQGPTKLIHCDIDNVVLANGLRGNSRLNSLILRRFSNNNNRGVSNQEVLAIAGALKENKGLVDLYFAHVSTISDETWNAFCDSLKTHPTLQVLTFQGIRAHGGRLFSPAVLKSWIQTLVDMLKVNMSIHTMHLPGEYSEHELFRRSVIPYLETNRLRPRVRAIQKTLPLAYRAKVLGRALLAVRTDPNRFWMLLSGNPEVALLSTTATTTPTANLPTPAAAAATSNAATGNPTDNVAMPTVCKKRKARL
jgi:hypothetical protein